MVSNILYVNPYVLKISNLTNTFQMGWNHQPGKDRLPVPPLKPRNHPHWNSKTSKWCSAKKTEAVARTLLCDWSVLEGCTYVYIYIACRGCENHGVYMFISPGSLRKPGIWKQKTQKTWCLPCVHPKMDECKCKPERMQWINCTPGFNLVS